MPFARIDALLPTTAGVRVNPVAGGRLSDSIDAKGHTAGTHNGVDIYGGDAARTVRAPTGLQIIRVVDARKSDPDSTKGAAGPWWIDAYELDRAGSTTGNVLRFLHLEKVPDGLKAGVKVAQGTQLGTYWPKTYKGKEGHLHFEVRSKSGDGYGEVRDPVSWLRGGE